MYTRVTIKDNDQINKLFEGEIEDRNHIIFNNGFFNQIDVYDNGIVVTCKDNDHETVMELVENPKICVTTKEGSINLSLKILDFSKSSDIITIRYKIESDIKEIKIEYLRSVYGNYK